MVPRLASSNVEESWGVQIAMDSKAPGTPVEVKVEALNKS